MQTPNLNNINDNPSNADSERLRQPLQRHPLPPRPSRRTIQSAGSESHPNRRYICGSNPTSYITPAYQPVRSRQRQYDHDQSLKAKGPLSHQNKSSASGMTQRDHSATGVHLGMGPNVNARVARTWGPPSEDILAVGHHGWQQPKAEEALRRDNQKIPTSHRSATSTGNGFEEGGLEEGEIEEIEIEDGEIGEEREEELLVEEGKDEDEDFDTISLGSD